MRYFTLNNGRNGKDFICGDTHDDLMECLKTVCESTNQETLCFIDSMAERIAMQGGETVNTDTEQAFITDLINHGYLILQDVQ